MLVALDLTQLYFAARKENVVIDYKKLADWFREQAPECTLIAFTQYDHSYARQRTFIESLTACGYDVTTVPKTDTPRTSFILELAVSAAMREHDDIIFVTGDPKLLRVLPIFKAFNVRLIVSFFGSQLSQEWFRPFIDHAVAFTDLRPHLEVFSTPRKRR